MAVGLERTTVTGASSGGSGVDDSDGSQRWRVWSGRWRWPECVAMRTGGGGSTNERCERGDTLREEGTGDGEFFFVLYLRLKYMMDPTGRREMC